MGGHAAERLGDLRFGIGTGAADQLDEHLKRAEETLGAAALKSQFARYLPPPLAFPANQPIGWHEDVVENNLVEIVIAGEVMIGRIVMPGALRSRISWLRPRGRSLSAGVVRTSVIAKCDSCA